MDKFAWDSKMLAKHKKSDIPDQLDEGKTLKYWDGVMSDAAKAQRNKSYEQIDDMALELLSLGYRIVKSSAITPEGEFGLGRKPEDFEQPSAANLFYEQKFNSKEFEGLYDYFGRYQNNFPDYFAEQAAFDQYAKNHDIWVIEDIQSNRPVAFSTFCISDDESERQAYGTKDGQALLYHDTVALDSELQGKHIGMKIMNIMDAYYLQTLGENINYALCTGEINTNAENILAKGFHEKRGFGQWQEGEASLEKWVKRYSSLQNKYGKKNAPANPGFMVQSYSGRAGGGR